jgi:hypothetical protein
MTCDVFDTRLTTCDLQDRYCEWRVVVRYCEWRVVAGIMNGVWYYEWRVVVDMNGMWWLRYCEWRGVRYYEWHVVVDLGAQSPAAVEQLNRCT